MEPIRILAFHERSTCRHGHTLDVWVRPQARGMALDPMVRCPHCGTLFVLTATRQHSVWAALDRADDTCPTCHAPMSDARPYPDRPVCRACAAQLRTWLTDGPDLPASAASVIRGWAVHRRTVDLTAIPAQRDLAPRERASR